ncbi:uncharacterized protein LOC135963383 [Calliphora vicina]|uniref:uncharacterized protein LOC135963383 n=1 Tax=Calliphora vicina TaxID=7373 RepID=UPI00325BE8DA
MERLRIIRMFPTCFLVVIILVLNFKLIRTKSNDPAIGRCPNGYIFNTDGLCYPKEISINRCPEGYILNTDGLCYPKESSINKCPEGYILYSDGLCYPIVTKPCPFDKANESNASLSTTIATPIAKTTYSPVELKELRCPQGSIMIKNKCRKIICTLGEYYRGTCLNPVCPFGLVWRGKKCQEPGYLTTVIEIDNDFVNEVNEKPIALALNQKNQVIYHTSTTTTTHKPSTTRFMHLNKTTIRPSFITKSTTASDVCCKVFTPRICKLYEGKWLCFNRKYQRCDRRICSSPVIYLKAPEIKHEPPILVMSPNPQLTSCETDDCRNNSNVDCSGCPTLRSENCSPYCYRSICSNATCTFMDLNEYCSYYPGQNGCLPNDGCLWNWCKANTYKIKQAK